MWEWEWIFGHAAKAICSLGVRSPCCGPLMRFYKESNNPPIKRIITFSRTPLTVRIELTYFQFVLKSSVQNILKKNEKISNVSAANFLRPNMNISFNLTWHHAYARTIGPKPFWSYICIKSWIQFQNTRYFLASNSS